MGKREEEVHERPGLRKRVRKTRGDGRTEGKTTYEWRKGGCNSWMEKVNAIAGGD